MSLVHRLFFREIFTATLVVSAGFLLLFGFFDLMDEIEDINAQYTLVRALLYVATLVPAHLYELLPICVLIACVLVLSRLALSSEFTILRTSGLGPGRALLILLTIGAVFSALTFAFGDYIAPGSNRLSDRIKGTGTQEASLWLRDTQTQGDFIVRVGALGTDNELRNITLRQFDDNARLIHEWQAERGTIDGGVWKLENTTHTNYTSRGANANTNANKNANTIHPDELGNETLARWSWRSPITLSMVNTALIAPSKMGAMDLLRYIEHLRRNQQNAHEYQIAFWRKLLYPLSCLVMVMLALPFAYLHHRSGGAAGFVFIGVMIGISFYLFNNLSNYIGNIHHWQPWFAAALPALIYSVFSLTIFLYLVFRH